MSTRDGLLLVDDSGHLTRTQSGSPSSTTTLTIAFWFEATTGDLVIFESVLAPAQLIRIFVSGGDLTVAAGEFGGTLGQRVKEGVISNATKYFGMVEIDPTQATAADRIKVWLGEYGGSAPSQITVWDTSDDIDENEVLLGDTVAMAVGGGQLGAADDGVIADFYLLDGQTGLGTSTFAQDSGGLKPVDASPTYGNFGFHLDFADADNLGNDISGNDNDFVTTGTYVEGSPISLSGLTKIGDMTDGGGLAAAFDGTTNQAASACAAKLASTATAYVGVTFAAPTRVWKCEFHGSNDQGYYSDNGSRQAVARARSGAAPANSGDGNVGGTLTFTDTSDESSVRTIELSSQEQATLYDHFWFTLGSSISSLDRFVAELIITETDVTPDIDSDNWVEDYLELAAGASSGAAVGTSAAAAVGAATASAVGAAAGLAVAAAVGTGGTTNPAPGTAAGTSTAAAIGRSTAASAGAASGLSTAGAVGTRFVALPITDTDALQMPVDYVLGRDAAYRDAYRERNVTAPRFRSSPKFMRSPARRLSSAPPSFSVTTTKRGYD